MFVFYILLICACVDMHVILNSYYLTWSKAKTLFHAITCQLCNKLERQHGENALQSTGCGSLAQRLLASLTSLRGFQPHASKQCLPNNLELKFMCSWTAHMLSKQMDETRAVSVWEDSVLHKRQRSTPSHDPDRASPYLWHAGVQLSSHEHGDEVSALRKKKAKQKSFNLWQWLLICHCGEDIKYKLQPEWGEKV